MILPQNGSVVIIDNEPEEALPILRALSKKGIATTYYEGNNPELLPKEPMQTVRMVFLDLQLIETASEHQIAKNIADILNKLISKENGPYILVIWSKAAAKYGTSVEEEIRQHSHLVPSCIIRFNKRDCLEEKVIALVDSNEVANSVLGKLEGRLDDDDEEAVRKAVQESLQESYQTEFIAKPDALEIIETNVKEGLETAGVFHLFVIWENLLTKAGTHTVKTITSTIKSTELWELNMRDVLKRMAKARTGKNSISETEALRASMTTFSYSFSEELESEIRDYIFPDYIKLGTDFLIAGKAHESVLEIRKADDKGTKVKLLKDGAIVKGKEQMSVKVIDQLSNGLTDPDKSTVEYLTSSYSKIPHLINTKLHLELNPNDELIPGNIYKIDVSEQKKKEYLQAYFDNVKGDLENYTFIELEVSPICDYAQTKWKKSRLISGIVYSGPSKPKDHDHHYVVKPSVLIDDKPNRIVFDFHLFKSLDHSIVSNRVIWFRLKRELLLDVIANLSGHVNRPGISFMA